MTRPIVGIAVHWIIGMSIAAGGSLANVFIAATAAALLWAAYGLAQSDPSFKANAQRVILYSAALSAGAAWYMWTDVHNESRWDTASAVQDGTELTIRGTIVSDPLIDGDRAEMIVRLNEISEWIKVYVRFQTLAERQEGASWRRGDLMKADGIASLPAPAANFGTFDYRQYLRRQHIHWVFTVKGLPNAEVSRSSDWNALRAAAYVDELRRSFAERLASIFSGEYEGFMQGLVIGMKDGIHPEQLRQFSQIGLTHILAISGLHVAIYVGAVLWLLRRLPLTRETQLACAMAAVPLYVTITGASPSVVRAGIMAILALYAARRRLLKDGLHVLSFAAIAMLAWNPYYLHDVSFQLSFAVTAGLIIGVPRMNRLLPIKHYWLKSSLSVTLTAQAVSFPLTLYYFNGFSALSFPANLVLVPLFSFIVLPIGTGSLVLSYVSSAAAKTLAWFGERTTSISFAAVEHMNALHGAHSAWATPSLWWIAVYYLLIFTLLHILDGGTFGQHSPVPRVFIGALTALSIIGLLVYAYMPDAWDRSGTVSFLDVGQGDAILVRTPSGKHVLIDGGGTLAFMKPGESWRQRRDPYEVGRKLLVPLLKQRGVHRIDALFISHEDTDHIGGLQAVVEEIPVARIWFNGTWKPGAASEALFHTAMDRGIPLVAAYSGDDLELDGDTRIHILYPPLKAREIVTAEENQNDASLVFLLTLYGKKLLFAGDIGAATEGGILADPGIAGGMPVDIAKISHHGSKSSTTDQWLQAWRPKAAVISVGRRNVYGHPHSSVIERLEAHHIAVLRTDMHGEVQFRIGPRYMKIRTKLKG